MSEELLRYNRNFNREQYYISLIAGRTIQYVFYIIWNTCVNKHLCCKQLIKLQKFTTCSKSYNALIGKILPSMLYINIAEMKRRGLPNGRIYRLITCRQQYMKCYIIKSNKLVNNPIRKQVPRYNICYERLKSCLYIHYKWI